MRDRAATLVLADVRWYLDGRSGRNEYDRGHLPGAIFVDLDLWLTGSASPEAGRHPLPEPEHFAEGMSSLGISDDDTVIAYDDAGGVMAARLVWMLRVTGRNAALLDGGLHAFDGILDTELPTWERGRFEVRDWPADRIAHIDDASNVANVVLDARTGDRYRGEDEPVDPRAGHIPGALSLSCRDNVDAFGRFHPVQQLRSRLESLGVEDGASVVAYCGSGITACHNLLTLELAGFGHGRLYPGSWSQYSRTDRPVAAGHAP